MAQLKISISELPTLVGTTLGSSEWLTVDQPTITAFGTITHDEQWIHLDEERAAAGPFGSTIAHGYLTLALLSGLWMDIVEVTDASAGVNYGLDKVRFPAPVPVGSRIRATVSLLSVEAIDGGVQFKVKAVIEREGSDRPVCVAEPIYRYYS